MATCEKSQNWRIKKVSFSISQILTFHHPLGLNNVLQNPNAVVKIMKKQS